MQLSSIFLSVLSPFVRRRTASFAYREDSATRFVEDDSPGIDPEDIARLFSIRRLS